MDSILSINLPSFKVQIKYHDTHLLVSMENDKVYITAKCPIRTTMELIGGKWKLLILYQLYDKPLRLSALKSSIPDISEKMLIQDLKILVDSDLVERKDYGEVPPKVEYALTDKGKNIMPLIKEMVKFAELYAK